MNLPFYFILSYEPEWYCILWVYKLTLSLIDVGFLQESTMVHLGPSLRLTSCDTRTHRWLVCCNATCIEAQGARAVERLSVNGDCTARGVQLPPGVQSGISRELLVAHPHWLRRESESGVPACFQARACGGEALDKKTKRALMALRRCA